MFLLQRRTLRISSLNNFSCTSYSNVNYSHHVLHYILAATAKSLHQCPTLCDPMDSSPPGSPAPGILQARTLEWVAISFSNITSLVMTYNWKFVPLFFFSFLKYNRTYVFLFVLGLRDREGFFLAVISRGCHLVVVCRLLIGEVSLLADHGLQGAQSQQLLPTGLVALRHVEFSRIRD